MALPVTSGTWTLDATATAVAFTIRNMLVRTVPGSFATLDGTGEIGSDLAGSSMSATVDATSFDTGTARRDQHVERNDFFDVAEHPTMDRQGR